jgi:ribosomal protein L11 methyltransferase
VRRVSFRLPAEEKEDLLDALMPLLPAGVRERVLDGREVELATVSAAPPARDVLEAAVGTPLGGWREEDVPADWRARRARFGGGASLVGGRLLVRSPWDPPAPDGVVDVVIQPGGGGFGSGSHATTRMCLALLLDLEPSGGAADLGCGLGTLAIAAARLGWRPVAGVDRMDGAVAAARANAARNGVEIDWVVADLTVAPLPLAPLLLVNAPPAVHARLAAALAAHAAGPAASSPGGESPSASDPAASPPGGASPAAAGPAASSPGMASPHAAGPAASASSPGAPAPVRRVIASGLVPAELAASVGAYEAAGFAVRVHLDEDGWAAALLERGDG